MINVKELRFGNKVQPDKEHAAQFNNIRVWSVTQIYEGGFTVDYHWPGKWFEGIPLSPEILKAAGFEYIKEKAKDSKQIAEGYRLGSFFLQPDDKNRWIVDWLNFGAIHQRIYMREISFVHELQNLFFALTGTELNINLEKVKV